ncbi:hypothetical protein [Streptomyces cellulosae]|uniref:Uncharacterized protein n=1 Tax=Streptomyces cellulosae TaxID=1968 RepID=A0ABW7XSU3_STRCE
MGGAGRPPARPLHDGRGGSEHGRSGDFVLLGLTVRFTSADGTEPAAVDETIVVLEAVETGAAS